MKNDEQVFPFAIVPVEVTMDSRLTLESMRVLVVLYSFRDKDTGLAFPSREAISVRCGMHPSNISDATTKLVELGWLKKTGSGGYSKATRYTIHVPGIVAEQATLHRAKSEARKEIKVAQSATLAEQATVAQSATPESSPSGYTSNSLVGYTQRTDQLTDHLTKKHIQPVKQSPENLLSGIDPQIASDYLAIRKAKNLPLTKTALVAIEREAEKANYTLEQTLRVCCENGWGSFKAAWIMKEEHKNKNTLEQENKESTQRAKARLFGMQTEKDITNEATRL